MATDFSINKNDTEDGRAEKRNQKPLLRRRKGWPGFVHGYNDWLASDGYENVKWNKDPKKSGAKTVTKDGNKTIYKF
jgi:hypothetical protein